MLFREAFKMFDQNNDGFIDMKELRKVTVMLGTMLTKEEVEEFMAEADTVEDTQTGYTAYEIITMVFQDGNGKLDYDEFVKMLLQY